MKLTTFILIVALAQVSARGFGQKITLNTKNTSIEKVLQAIRDQSGYEVIYKTKELKSEKISINLNNATINEAMEQVVKGLPYTFEIVNKNVVVSKKEPSFLDRLASVIANDDGKFADIRGVVRNERGEALEGITVMVKGAKTGTRTNAKGEFMLKGVKKGDVLVFTGVAIEPFEYTVKDDKNIDLNLKARLVQLEEVAINTGYQKISKERYVGSYSQLDSAAFHRRAGMGILERLDGTVTGVLFNKKLSEVAESYESPIQIRGLSTLNSNQNPLVIVDNFPYTLELSTINPNDVENVVVLKDAAAASIWGARAGNGVIVITTKKGRFNQKLQVSATTNFTIQEKPKLADIPTMSSSDFIDVEKFLFENNFYSTILQDELNRPIVTPVVELLDKIDKGLIEENIGIGQINALRDLDYRDDLSRYVYQKQLFQQHNLNMSGGTNVINYRLSLGFNRNGPALQNTKGQNQYSINTNTTIKASKKIEFFLGMNLTQNVDRSATLPIYRTFPYQKLVDEIGNPIGVPNQYRQGYLDTVGAGGYLDWQLKPLDELRLADRSTISKNILVNASMSYKVLPWLDARLQTMYASNTANIRNLQSLGTYSTRSLINKFTSLQSTDVFERYPVPLGGVLDIMGANSSSYNLRGQLNVNKSFGKDHQLTGLLAFEINDNNFETNGERFYGYNPRNGSVNKLIDYSKFYNTFQNNFEQIPNGSILSEENVSRLVSVISNFSYTFKDRYTFYASARRDGANVFGVNTNNRWKPLWSVAGSWQINKEPFFDLAWMPNLNLRVSYGYSGNVNNAISGLPTIQYSSTLAAFTGLPYADRGFAPNPDLRWEQVRFTNFALDFSLFNNAIDGSIEYYLKKSTDLISNVPLAPTSGLRSFVMNSASLKGNGIELNIRSQILKSKPFSWNLQLGLSYSRNVVDKVFLPNLYRVRDFVDLNINPTVGGLAYSLSSYKWGGLDPATGNPQGYLNGLVSKDYAKIFEDSVSNQIIHGSSIPLISGFLQNSVSWKNLSLSFNISYRLNFYYRKPSINYSRLFFDWTGHPEFKRRWQKSGDEISTNVPSMIYPIPTDLGQRDEFYQKSEINVLRGDNIRLNDVRLQYTGRNMSRSVLKYFDFFLYLNNLNLVIWQKDKSEYDPDFAGGAVFQLKPSKTYTFGFNFNF